jgi:hypothetical protein
MYKKDAKEDTGSVIGPEKTPHNKKQLYQLNLSKINGPIKNIVNINNESVSVSRTYTPVHSKSIYGSNQGGKYRAPRGFG